MTFGHISQIPRSFSSCNILQNLKRYISNGKFASVCPQKVQNESNSPKQVEKISNKYKFKRNHLEEIKQKYEDYNILNEFNYQQIDLEGKKLTAVGVKYNGSGGSCLMAEGILLNPRHGIVHLQKMYYSRIPDDIPELRCARIEDLERNRDRMRKEFGCPSKEGHRIKVLKWNDEAYPWDECIPCDPDFPKSTYTPKLNKPKRRFDYNKMKYPHPCKDICVEEIVRADDGHKLKYKRLSYTPSEECYPCVDEGFCTKLKLKRIEKLYDDSKLPFYHKCKSPCPEECLFYPPRLDDELGYKVKAKRLPRISWAPKCAPPECEEFRLPILKRLHKRFSEDKMKFRHKFACYTCLEKPFKRADDRAGYKVRPKTLCKFPFENDCEDCVAHFEMTPSILPRLEPPTKAYDHHRMPYNHRKRTPKVCPPPCAPRADEIRGYRIESKKLKAFKASNDCIPCHVVGTRPRVVRLRGPCKCYDDTKMPYPHKCKLICDEEIKRADDGYKMKVKCLKSIYDFESDCIPCDAHFAPGAAKIKPKLKPPKKRYDDSKMKFKYRIKACKICDEVVRADDFYGYEVVKKKLKHVPTNNDCIPCDASAYDPEPPKLNRLKPRYDPCTDPVRCYPLDVCNVDPPRMDDVLCYRPSKKILPAFITYNTDANHPKPVPKGKVLRLPEKYFKNQCCVKY